MPSGFFFLSPKEWRTARPPSWGRRELRTFACSVIKLKFLPLPRNVIKYNPAHVGRGKLSSSLSNPL